MLQGAKPGTELALFRDRRPTRATPFKHSHACRPLPSTSRLLLCACGLRCDAHKQAGTASPAAHKGVRRGRLSTLELPDALAHTLFALTSLSSSHTRAFLFHFKYTHARQPPAARPTLGTCSDDARRCGCARLAFVQSVPPAAWQSVRLFAASPASSTGTNVVARSANTAYGQRRVARASALQVRAAATPPRAACACQFDAEAAQGFQMASTWNFKWQQGRFSFAACVWRGERQRYVAGAIGSV